MSATASLVYPQNFTRRPADRDLIGRLTDVGTAPDTAEVLLYRLWQEFANGASDRRKLGDGSFAEDRAAQLIESACLWSGEAGLLVLMAVDAGFLTLKSDPDGRWLICQDFYPMNATANRSGYAMQRKGAYARLLKPAIEKADIDANRHLELWKSTGHSDLKGLSEESQKRVLMFLHRISRAAARPIPSEQVMRWIVPDAVKCLDETDEDTVRETLLYLVSQRKDPSIPGDLKGIVRMWPELVAKAKKG